MMIPLAIYDPLVGQEVTIVLTSPAGDGPRDERPVLVSLGVSGQLPIIKTGTFAEAPTLIDEAWIAFGVRTQVAPTLMEPEIETADEELVATAAVPEAAPTSPEKPPAGNLSLF